MRHLSVQIIQPLIPAYRVPLFNALAGQADLRLSICASRTIPGIDSLTSVDDCHEYADLDHPCRGILGSRLLWQKNLRIDAHMRAGDVLVVSGSPRLLSNIPLIRAARKRRIGVVWWGHGFSKRPTRLKTAIRAAFLYWADTILLYTDEELQRYKQQGFPPEKLFAANNTIDQSPIREAKADWQGKRLEEFRRHHGLAGYKVLLFCGRLIKRGQLHLLLEAMTLLEKRGRKCRLVVLGAGEQEDKLRRQAVDLGVQQSIHWPGQIYDQSLLAPWFLSADWFVYPGAIGLSLLHAFAYGLPVITHGNLSEHGPEIAALQDGVNGFLFRHGSAQDLAAKLARLLNDPQRQSQASARALQIAEGKYNMENMVRRFSDAIYAASLYANR